MGLAVNLKAQDKEETALRRQVGRRKLEQMRLHRRRCKRGSGGRPSWQNKSGSAAEAEDAEPDYPVGHSSWKAAPQAEGCS